ncbi:MAG: thioredoxin family protein [Candidatus Neomarinimicrobiota bacterium]
MKKLSALIISGVFIFSGLPAAGLELGATIPLADQKMPDVSGKSLSLSEIAGKEGLLVIFSCNTCPWVKLWEDRYLTLAAKYIPQGIGMVAINSNAAYRDKGDNLEDMQANAGKMGYNFYYALDLNSELALAFGATKTPHVFLFDRTGKLVYRGAIDDNARQPEKVEQHYLVDAIDAMLAGKPITANDTKALGCTIKFVKKQ